METEAEGSLIWAGGNLSGSIQISGLRKSFARADGGSNLILPDIDLSMAGGEFVCLVGPSGCGKTTILHTIAGVVEKDAGSIMIDGRDHMQARIGYVFQESRLLNWLTALENIKFAAAAAGIPPEKVSETAKKYLELVGLSEFGDAYPLTLSGGMQQRVAIARALAVQPDVLLMDEPFSSLDELTARTLRRELLRLWTEDRHTVIFITHNTLEAAYLADRIYVLGGRGMGVTAEFVVDAPRPRDFEDLKVISLQKKMLAALSDH
jgi:ABC-type nitrate/sulfonate/bicarbonate transport system ATPase subunit